MPLLDIETGIRNKEIKSRFRLVHLAGIRSRELLNPKENTLPSQEENYDKYTTKALSEIIDNKVNFEKITEEEQTEDE